MKNLHAAATIVLLASAATTHSDLRKNGHELHELSFDEGTSFVLSELQQALVTRTESYGDGERRMEIRYPSFRSSDRYCRLYETVVVSPAPFCEMCESRRTYAVVTTAYVALLTDKGKGACHLQNPSEYFSVEPDMSDIRIDQILLVLEEQTSRLQSELSVPSEKLAAMKVENLVAIRRSDEPKAAPSGIEFWFNLPSDSSVTVVLTIRRSESESSLSTDVTTLSR